MALNCGQRQWELSFNTGLIVEQWLIKIHISAHVRTCTCIIVSLLLLMIWYVLQYSCRILDAWSRRVACE